MLKKMKKIISMTLVFALVTSLLAACGTTKVEDKPGQSSATEAAKTSPIVIAVDNDLSTMDHNLGTDQTSFVAITLAMAGLVELDENGVAVPDLAESWDVSEDGKTYTFHLREAKWSNGTPITAHDFVYGWRRLINPATPFEYNFLLETLHVVNAADVISGNLPVEELGVKALDDKTLEVKLDLPVDFMLSLLAFPSFFPLNQEYHEAQGDKYATTPENLIYSGPYVMENWTPGNSFSFVKNPSYYKSDEIKQEKIEFRFIQDTQSAMLEFQSGNLDVVKLSGEMVDAYKDDAAFNQILQGYLWFLPFNFNVPDLQNLNLRKAIAHAIDRETIAVHVLKDGSIEANGIVPSKFSTSPKGNDFRDEAEDLTVFDKELALKYYEEAKKELGHDVTIELLFEDSEASKAVAEYIQNNLETTLTGIKINLNSKPKKTRIQLMRDNDYELALHRWGPDYADPQTYIDLFLTGSSMNLGKYHNPKYDELVNKAISGEYAADSQKRWDAFIEAEKILVVEDYAVVPVYQNGGAMMINPAVKGLEFHTAGVDNYRRAVKAN